ncbi:copper resistance protein B [Robbsia andropogonis]|uniref:copper resistance protein B n=2 Tax=Robbsia andropogonis TaxID=28092 RepID=UPI0004B353B9|nr:copper resistance protein B [Robbsia andropogonis]MCP1121217.1 copper resistance protein B [Robbsia andropogonis]MCP1131036.1 copper resistance protein B [Robbsia andropogonis]
MMATRPQTLLRKRPATKQLAMNLSRVFVCVGAIAVYTHVTAAPDTGVSGSMHDMPEMNSDPHGGHDAPTTSSSDTLTSQPAAAIAPANVILPDKIDPVRMTAPNLSMAMSGMDMHDDAIYHQILFDQFGYQSVRGVSGMRWDMSGWIGGDRDRFFFRSEGQRIRGNWSDVRIEGAWRHAVDRYWNTLLGMRTDLGSGPTRYWGMVGVQGVMPWYVNLSAMAYVDPSGRTALWARADYDWRFTQRLVLTPELEVNAYGRRDAARSVGAGISDMTASLRLRYEVTRKFAPYIGLTWERPFGATAAMLRGRGTTLDEVGIDAGVRFWF